MTNTVFSMFQTLYILIDFLSASRSSGPLGFSKHWDFQSKDVASARKLQNDFAQHDPVEEVYNKLAQFLQNRYC
jgi:hypothetical protein